MSAPATVPTHEQLRRKVLGEAYAFALSVARRPDPPANVEAAPAATGTASESSQG